MEATALLGIVIVFGLLGLLLYALKRGGMMAFNGGFMSKTSGKRELELIDRLALTPTHSLHMIRAGSRTLLVSVGPQACQYVADLDPATREGLR